MRLLDNPHHKDELWRLGVRPGTAFACGIDFLLRIRPEALEPHAAVLQVVVLPTTGAVVAVHMLQQCMRARRCVSRCQRLCMYLNEASSAPTPQPWTMRL